MRCDLDPSRVAIWSSTKHVCGYSLSWLLRITRVVSQCIKLSAFAAQTLADAKLLDVEELDLHRASQLFPFIQQTLKQK
jgi:sterol 3beta-glucosyltransferase